MKALCVFLGCELGSGSSPLTTPMKALLLQIKLKQQDKHNKPKDIIADTANYNADDFYLQVFVQDCC